MSGLSSKGVWYRGSRRTPPPNGVCITKKAKLCFFCIFLKRFWDSDLVSSVKYVSPAAAASSFQSVALNDAAAADSSADAAASKVGLVARVAWAAGVSEVGESPAGCSTRTGES